MPRIFAALTIPHDMCDTLTRDLKVLPRYDALARFTPSTNLHITLAFLGEMPLDTAIRISAAIRPLATVTPRTISTGRLGHFGSRTIWLGLTPEETLYPVAAEVRKVLDEMKVTYDTTPLKPHITVARGWRRPFPYVTLPQRTFRLGGPILLQSDADPRTGQMRYRQIF